MRRSRLARTLIATRRRRRGRRNPLRRRSDRVERRARIAGLLVFVLTLPLAFWVGARSYGHGQQAVRASQAGRQQTAATLTEDAPAGALLAPGGAATSTFALARWVGPERTARTGYLRVPAGTPKGTAVPIWVDRTGRPVDPPATRSALGRSAAGAGIGTAAAGALLLLLGIALLHAILNRSRMRAWEAEWAAVEPGWSSYRP
jgi:hypothetical protein